MTGDDDLDDLFAAARAAAPVPRPDLVARVLADAQALQPRPSPPAPPQRGWIAALLAGLGGAGGLAGLATATLAGVWIGLAQPAPVAGLTATLWPAATEEPLDLLPDLEGMMTDAEG